MVPYNTLENLLKENPRGGELLGEKDGLVNGARCGISTYTRTEYEHMDVHDDQEGFYVLEGHGKAMVGDEEIIMKPGVTFFVPTGTPHGTKRDSDCEFCRVLWFHCK